jgi:AcrR family transcriptional regulator
MSSAPPLPEPAIPSTPRAARAPRSDGDDTRARLLQAALQLFSEHGFARTSVRAIAVAAGTNVAAIGYHFGDKARLYTATFYEPLGSGSDLIEVFAAPGLSLQQALQRYFTGFLEPLKHDDLVRQATRLHVRELLEPTHVWPELMERECKAPHMALVRLLRGHMGLSRIDDDLHRLAFSIGGLVMLLWTQRDAIEAIAPRLAGPATADAWAERLTGYAMSMVQGEMARRKALGPKRKHNNREEEE